MPSVDINQSLEQLGIQLLVYKSNDHHLKPERRNYFCVRSDGCF